MREAINSAIAEEMKLDENVFLMGEEGGEYQGAYKVSPFFCVRRMLSKDNFQVRCAGFR